MRDLCRMYDSESPPLPTYRKAAPYYGETDSTSLSDEPAVTSSTGSPMAYKDAYPAPFDLTRPYQRGVGLQPGKRKDGAGVTGKRIDEILQPLGVGHLLSLELLSRTVWNYSVVDTSGLSLVWLAA